MGAFVTLIMLGAFIFFVYLVIKQIQFIIKAIPLYEKMVSTQEQAISLLKEINENFQHKLSDKHWIC